MKRPLSPEEKKLWQLVTEGIKKLSAEAGAEEAPTALPPKPPKTPKIPKTAITGALPRSSGEEMLPQAGGIDHHTEKKFRRGEMPIDGSIDLHGLTQAAAHAALQAFIEHYYGKARCLLVVTGKGRGNAGILREMTPKWLASAPLGSTILAVAPAQPKHGGSGALYVLLKRKRPL